jgi:Fe-S-cluster-containing dehydrogenase component
VVFCFVRACRGDTPFCSEECRQRQIDADDASEMMKKRAKMQPAAARGEQQPQRRQSPHGIPVWAR